MDEHFEKMLDKAAQEARENVATGNDKGHSALITDLRDLLADAENCEFHDQLSTKYPAPKMALHERVLEIDKRMQEGNYDN